MSNENQFNRISLFNFMANDLVNFAASKYGQEFYEIIDMSCGALPEGDFEKVIDPSAPLQFLELYTNIVINRIVFVCEKILALGPGYKAVLSDYFFKEAQGLGLENISSISDAFETFNLYVLNSMNAQSSISIIHQKDSLIQWKQSGVNKNYFIYIEDFIKGLFAGSGIKFSFSEDSSGESLFTLEMIS